MPPRRPSRYWTTCPVCHRGYAPQAHQDCPHCGAPRVSSQAAALMDPLTALAGMLGMRREDAVLHVVSALLAEGADFTVYGFTAKELVTLRRMMAHHGLETMDALRARLEATRPCP